MILRPSQYLLLLFKSMLLSAQQLICQEILVLGDSHVMIFRKTRLRAAFPFYYFNVVPVLGATVSGLENPNSKTQALPIFLDNLNRSSACTIIIMLGEVDTGFVIWYKSQKNGAKVSEMLAKAVNNYQDLLSLLSQRHRVICISTPLPTIKDGQDWGEVANARREVTASQLDRTELTLRFNAQIREFCQINKMNYLDFDSESIGGNGIVRNRLINKNPTDHHYEPRHYIDMIIPKLRECIVQRSSPNSN